MLKLCVPSRRLRRGLGGSVLGLFAFAACSPFLDVAEIPQDYGLTAPCRTDLDCESFGARPICITDEGRCFDNVNRCERDEDVDQDITEDTLWTANVCYRILGTVAVKEQAELTIQPGTVIRGGDERSALVVTTQGNLFARGTVQDPIVFTSPVSEGARRPGDWGGVVLLGRAPINTVGGTDFIEGLPEEAPFDYGGTDVESNCGTLQYVRIEFAGFVFSADNELNGLSLGGCGSATLIDYVQVHYGADDGIEVFGGTVGLRRIVISRAQDDSLDWDQGWVGYAQQGVILQDLPDPGRDETPDDPTIFTGGEHGFEADSFNADNPGAPRSRPSLYNFTMVGSNGQDTRTLGMLLREGTSAVMKNFIISRYGRGLWDIRDAPTTTDCYDLARELDGSCGGERAEFDRILLHNMGPDGQTAVMDDESDNDGGFDEAAYFDALEAAMGSGVVHLRGPADGEIGWIQPFIEKITNNSPLDLRPSPGSLADLRNQDPSPYGDPRVDETERRYLGAFEPGLDAWIDGWTAFPEN